MKTLGEGKFLRLVRRGRWEYCERTNATGIVCMVAVTKAGELILVEQRRAPVRRRVVELPAGLSGDVKGDTLRRAANRELFEETGYRARRLEHLGDMPPSAGLSNEIVTMYRATGLKKVGEGGGDETESIKVHLVPLDEVPAWLERKVRRGALVDAKVYAGLWFATCR